MHVLASTLIFTIRRSILVAERSLNFLRLVVRAYDLTTTTTTVPSDVYDMACEHIPGFRDAGEDSPSIENTGDPRIELLFPDSLTEPEIAQSATRFIEFFLSREALDLITQPGVFRR